MIANSINMDFDALAELQKTMPYNRQIEFVYNKLYDNADANWDTVKNTPSTWLFPECWRARYWLYFNQCEHVLKDAHILDLGSNMNFYGVWALANGAKKITAVEPDVVRKKLGDEYVKICGHSDSVESHALSMEDYLSQTDKIEIDVVFLLDVLYYLDDPASVLKLIKNRTGTKYLLIESRVVDDNTEHGHFDVYYPSIQSKLAEIFKSDTLPDRRIALMPSRNALYNLLTTQGWKIISHYDYQDFKGHGESPPRRSGHTVFYLLANL